MPYVKSEYDDLDKYKYDNGDIVYYKKDADIVHNPYGAAVIHIGGYKAYCIEGKYHRLDGPAVIYANGKEEYFINNKCLTKEQFEIKILKILGKEHLTCLR